MTYTVKVYHPNELFTYKKAAVFGITEGGVLEFTEAGGETHRTNLPFDIVEEK